MLDNKNIILNDDAKQMLFEDCLRNGIKTNDKLHSFIHLFLDVIIPTNSVVPGNSAPFDFISDAFFTREEKFLVRANRSGGKTFNTAVLNILDMLFKPGIEITTSGAVVEQATKGFSFVSKFCRLPYIKEKLARERTMPYIIELTNGSSLKVITASEDGFNGPHPNYSNIDEVDLITWKDLQEAFSMSQSSPSYNSQDRLLSTVKSMTGTMAQLLEEADERGFKKYKWSIFEVLENCEYHCETCPVFEKCKGLAKKSNGYYKISDFIKKIKNLDLVVFKMQWLCEDEFSEGSFFFINKNDHFWTLKKLADFYNLSYTEDMPPEELIPKSWRKFIGCDFGFTDPSVFIAYAMTPDNRLVAYKEFYYRYLKASDVALAFVGKLKPEKEEAFDWRTQCLGDYDCIIPDPSGRTYIAEMVAKNKENPIKDNFELPFAKTINNREFGFDAVRQFLSLDITGIPRLIFLESCPNAQREHLRLRKNNERYLNQEIPDKKCDDHAIDPTRYVVSQVHYEEKTRDGDFVSETIIIGG